MKLEIVYNNGLWLLLDGTGKIIYESYDRYTYCMPMDLETAITEALGIKK